MRTNTMFTGIPKLNGPIASGDIERVRGELRRGADPNEKQMTGESALEMALEMVQEPAAECKHMAIARLLTEHGATVTLEAAAALGDVERLREILAKEKGAARRKNPGSISALSYAACHGSLEMTEMLLNAGADIKTVGRFGRQPLHQAAVDGRADLVELLLDRGADITTTTLGDAWTPLHCAAVGGDARCVELLLDRGADVAATSLDGSSPLDVGSATLSAEGIELLLARGAVHTVRSAAASGDLEALASLLDEGAPIDKNLPGVDTPALSLAAARGRLEVVKFLLDRGADISRQDKAGATPVQRALQARQCEIADYLAEQGGKIIDPNACLMPERE